MSACNAHLTATSGASRALSDDRPSRHQQTKGSPHRAPEPLTQPSQPDRHSRDGGNPVSFNGAWIPGLRCARNDGFGQSPNQSRQPTNPSAPGIAKRHRPDGPRCPERRSLSVAPKRTSPQGPQLCRMAGTQIPPSMTNLSAPPNAPPARWQPILPAAPHQPPRQPDQTIPCRSNPGAIRAR